MIELGGVVLDARAARAARAFAATRTVSYGYMCAVRRFFFRRMRGYRAFVRTATMFPLPHDTQRLSAVPSGERLSMALTCSSLHSCASGTVSLILDQTGERDVCSLDR